MRVNEKPKLGCKTVAVNERALMDKIGSIRGLSRTSRTFSIASGLCGDPRYIGVAFYLEILRRFEGTIKSGYLAFRNSVGCEYALDEVETDKGRVESLHYPDDVADELRVEAEKRRN